MVITQGTPPGLAGAYSQICFFNHGENPVIITFFQAGADPENPVLKELENYSRKWPHLHGR